MTINIASAQWQGDLPTGKGEVSLGNGAFKGEYSFKSRFEDGKGTNPEELIAAAHAACFSMAFSHGLAQAGFTPTSVQTKASVALAKDANGFAISQIVLDCEGDVPSITEAKFYEIGNAAKANCPISKALAAVPTITLNAKLKKAAA